MKLGKLLKKAISMSWWNSLDWLKQVNLILVWAGAGFTVFAAITAVVIIIVGQRINTLTQNKDTERQRQAEVKEAELRRQISDAQIKASNIQNVFDEDKVKQETIRKQLQEKLDLAEASIAHAKESAESAKLKAIEIEEKQKPRTLSISQKNRLTGMLKKEPNGSIDILAISGEKEPSTFADEIAEVFRNAGWKVTRSTSLTGSSAKGMGILVHSKETAPPYTLLLQESLKSIGYEALANVSSNVAPNTLKLVIAHKP